MKFLKKLNKMKNDSAESLEETKALMRQATEDLRKAKILESDSIAIVATINLQLEVNHFAQRYLEALGGTK